MSFLISRGPWFLSAMLVVISATGPLSFSQTNAPPVPVEIQAETTNTFSQVTPFLLYTGVDDEGNPVYEKPPEWMLEGEPKEPEFTKIVLKFYDKLDTNQVYEFTFRTPRNTAFAGWEIVEE